MSYKNIASLLRALHAIENDYMELKNTLDAITPMIKFSTKTKDGLFAPFLKEWYETLTANKESLDEMKNELMEDLVRKWNAGEEWTEVDETLSLMENVPFTESGIIDVTLNGGWPGHIKLTVPYEKNHRFVVLTIPCWHTPPGWYSALITFQLPLKRLYPASNLGWQLNDAQVKVDLNINGVCTISQLDMIQSTGVSHALKLSYMTNE
jgi:hypothetical protein